MENLSSSSSSSMKMQFLLLEQVQFLKVNDDTLLQWELVDVIDAEEDEEEWGKSGDEVDNSDGLGYWDSLSVYSPNDDLIEGIDNFLPHIDVGDHVVNHDHHVDEADGYDGHDNDDDVDHDDDDDDGGDDLDDELVPWDIGNKFGRQRMRKLGKRAFSKMHNSKRNPYLFTRPGCVRGKHGLGLKHTF